MRIINTGAHSTRGKRKATTTLPEATTLMEPGNCQVSIEIEVSHQWNVIKK